MSMDDIQQQRGRLRLRAAIRMAIASSALVAGATPMPASAALEEVVVTAQRREESIQEVPVAVSALTSEGLEKMSLASVSDLRYGAVPSLNVQPFSGRPDDLQISIRGIGETDPVQSTLDRAVPIYLDGVYLARAAGSGAELGDIERIEVLRGPQGTLFGRNAMGGAVSVTTVKPSGEFHFKTSFDYGSYDKIRSKTSIDLPEWNGFSGRIDFIHSERGGWTDLTANALAKIRAAGIDEDWYREDQFGWFDRNGGRLALRWQPNEQWDFNYTYDRMDTLYVQTMNTLSNCPAPGGNFVPCNSPLSWVPQAQGRVLDSDVPLAIPPNHTKVDGHTLNVQFDLNDELTLKSITAFRNMKDTAYSPIGQVVTINLGVLSIGDPQNTTAQSQSQWSQEFQIIGKRDRLDYTLGAMYFNEEVSLTTFTPYGIVNVDALRGLAGGAFAPGLAGFGSGPIPYTPAVQNALIPIINAVFGPGQGNALFGPGGAFSPRGSGQTIAATSEVSTDSVGVYGQATWTPPVLDDKLKVTMGLRYSHDRKKLIKLTENGRVVNLELDLPIDRVDPAASVAYDWTDDTSTYVRYGRAYRNGGASVRESTLFAGGVPVTILGQPDNGFHTFEAEQVETWEVGIKTDFWEDRARINAALFYSEYDDHQISIQKPGQISNTYFFNYPETITVKGFEIEATVSPIDGLTAMLGYTWLDDEIPRPDVDPGFNVLPFTIIAQAPAHRWTAQLDYVFPEMAFGKLDFHMDTTGSSTYNFNDASNLISRVTNNRQNNHGGWKNSLINLRLTLSDIPVFGPEKGRVKAAFYIRNLTDQEWSEYGFGVPNGATGLVGPPTSTVYGDPRTFGFNVSYEY
ncbi:MAG: TonB-dependent receptor [Gammaproteobacteria bacterium]